jgi:hypothetical protein
MIKKYLSLTVQMSQPPQPITNVRIMKDSLFKKIMCNPFKYYYRAGGWTFCLVAASNLFTTLSGIGRTVSDDDNMISSSFLTEHPQLCYMGILSKSVYFGLLWPTFYLAAMTNPKSAFVFGGSAEIMKS